MKLLVIGSSGQLAQSIFEQKRADLEVILVGRSSLDIANEDAVRQLLETCRPEIVVNAAAYTAVDQAEFEPDKAMHVNAVGARVLAQGCRSVEAPLVHISTDYVYDGTKTSPYLETDAPRPINAYGQSKLAGELAIVEATGRHVILRTSWLFSPYGKNFLNTMLRLAQSQNEVCVVDDQVGAPTYAPDLAEAIIAIAPRLISGTSMEPFGTYHVAAQGETAWSGFAAEIFRLQQKRGARVPRLTPIPSSTYESAARRPANSRLDCGKFERVFGIRLPSWQDGVAKCLARISAGSD